MGVLLAHPQLDVAAGKPVFLAAQEGYDRILSKLLAVKVAPDRLHTDTGISPLGMACQEGHTAVVKRLLKAGASVNRKDKLGRVPLEIARTHAHKEVIAALTGHLGDGNEHGNP